MIAFPEEKEKLLLHKETFHNFFSVGKTQNSSSWSLWVHVRATIGFVHTVWLLECENKSSLSTHKYLTWSFLSIRMWDYSFRFSLKKKKKRVKCSTHFTFLLSMFVPCQKIITFLLSMHHFEACFSRFFYHGTFNVLKWIIALELVSFPPFSCYNTTRINAWFMFEQTIIKRCMLRKLKIKKQRWGYRLCRL